MVTLYSEGAVGVVNKGALTLDDAELKIAIRKPVKELPIDTKRLLVKGLSDKTTRDGLQSYMEVVSGVEVLSIEFGLQGSAAVTFDETYGKFDKIFLSDKTIKKQQQERFCYYYFFKKKKIRLLCLHWYAI